MPMILIQQRRLAVVDVPQKRDDRRTRLQFGRIVGLGVGNGLEALFDGLRLLHFDLYAELRGQQFDQFGIDRRHGYSA